MVTAPVRFTLAVNVPNCTASASHRNARETRERERTPRRGEQARGFCLPIGRSRSQWGRRKVRGWTLEWGKGEAFN